MIWSNVSSQNQMSTKMDCEIICIDEKQLSGKLTVKLETVLQEPTLHSHS